MLPALENRQRRMKAALEKQQINMKTGFGAAALLTCSFGVLLYSFTHTNTHAVYLSMRLHVAHTLVVVSSLVSVHFWLVSLRFQAVSACFRARNLIFRGKSAFVNGKALSRP